MFACSTPDSTDTKKYQNKEVLPLYQLSFLYIAGNSAYSSDLVLQNYELNLQYVTSRDIPVGNCLLFDIMLELIGENSFNLFTHWEIFFRVD